MTIGIQLPTIQQEMDTQSVELLEQQQQSLAGRKRLAELTRGKNTHTHTSRLGYLDACADYYDQVFELQQ